MPAIAVSVTSHFAANFEMASEVAKKLAVKIVDEGLEKGTMLNVNVPDIPKEEIKGVVFTTQGKSRWNDLYEERTDPYG